MTEEEIKQLKADYIQTEKEYAELKIIAENRSIFIDWVINNYPEIINKYLDL